MTVETDPTPLQQDMHAALRQSLAEQGQRAPDLTPEQLRALSASMARLLARRIGGRYVAFVEDRAQRDAAVLQAWTGRNRAEVMQRFGISRALFYNILMRAFVNTRLAETWEEAGDKVSQHELAKRASDRPLGIVPIGGLMLTQGVDTQPDRLERRVWAYGRGERSWLVDVEIIPGDPNLPEGAEGSPWNRLTEARSTPVRHASGAQMLIEATFIDSGGHNTQAVYAYARDHANAQVFALKGASQPGKPALGKASMADINWRGRVQPRGLKLWPVGTDTIKHLIFGRLRLSQPGPGYIDLPADLAKTDEFEQLTAERLATSFHKGHARLSWVKPNGKRNEALDCAVYAYAGAVYLGVARMRENDWDRREQKVQPREQDLFTAPQPQHPDDSPSASRPNRPIAAPPQKPQPQNPQGGWIFDRRD